MLRSGNGCLECIQTGQADPSANPAEASGTGKKIGAFVGLAAGLYMLSKAGQAEFGGMATFGGGLLTLISGISLLRG